MSTEVAKRTLACGVITLSRMSAPSTSCAISAVYSSTSTSSCPLGHVGETEPYPTVVKVCT